MFELKAREWWLPLIPVGIVVSLIHFAADKSNPLIFILDVVGVWFGILALLKLIFWFVDMVIARIEKLRIAVSTSTLSVAAREVSRLTPEQVKLVPPYQAGLEQDVDVTKAGPVFYYRSPDGLIPAWFFQQFLDDSSITNLPAIGSYKADENNSREWKREMARRCTRVWIEKGLAYEAYGDEPAKWNGSNARANARMMAYGEPEEV